MSDTARAAARELLRRLRSEQAWIIDTEATGLHAEAEIIELGIIELGSGKEIQSERFCPDWPSKPEAEAIHGIRNEELGSEPRFAKRAESLSKLLNGATLISWIETFDREILEREFRRASIRVPEIRWICASVLYHLLDFGTTNQYCSLEEAAKSEGISTEGLHSALGDARIVREVLQAAE